MENENYKEVYFSEYCASCVYKEKDEEYPKCAECLDEPVRLYSHRPKNWTNRRGVE